jgi:precorrin-6Y C5,15-methyltransferase (decarboxylating)
VPQIGAEQLAWSSPLSESLPSLLAANRGKQICVLASGDPTFHGIGTTLVRLLGAAAVRVIPHPSSVSLACARLGWPQEQVQVISLVGHRLERLHSHVQPDRRLIILSEGAHTPREVAAALVARGYGASEFTVLEQLGSDHERVRATRAADWDDEVDALNIVAVLCRADAAAPLLPTVPGLPDEAYESDGQLTKREVRAATLAALVPLPGQLLWDVGSGCGSIGIEWMRASRGARAVAIEREPSRQALIAQNAATLGVPRLRVIAGAAPGALAGLDPPDAIFIGGGVSDAMIESCWSALKPAGRLAANVVTLEGEVCLLAAQARRGGNLTRIAISRADAIGSRAAWRPLRPVTQWSVTKHG